MAKGLFCYTTKINDLKTVAEIEAILTKAGASRIMKKMGQGGHVEALSFTIMTEKDGVETPFKLPMDVEPVMQLIKAHAYDEQKRREQAYRVGWRILLYWVKAQCAVIETKMVELEQVFLPYVQISLTETLYDKYKRDRSSVLELTTREDE